MQSPRTSPRAEYLAQERERVLASPSLAKKFRKLKSLTVELGFYDSAGEFCSSQVKYTVNLDNAKSVFCFSCQNQECVRGDYDLSEALAKAIAARQTSVSSEVHCQGWRNRAMIDSVPCNNLLRYKFTLKY